MIDPTGCTLMEAPPGWSTIVWVGGRPYFFSNGPAHVPDYYVQQLLNAGFKTVGAKSVAGIQSPETPDPLATRTPVRLEVRHSPSKVGSTRTGRSREKPKCTRSEWLAGYQERRQKALAMRQEGKTWQAIADALGFKSKQAAIMAVKGKG